MELNCQSLSQNNQPMLVMLYEAIRNPSQQVLESEHTVLSRSLTWGMSLAVNLWDDEYSNIYKIGGK